MMTVEEIVSRLSPEQIDFIRQETGQDLTSENYDDVLDALADIEVEETMKDPDHDTERNAMASDLVTILGDPEGQLN